MKHVIICDESYTSGRYLVLGALILPAHNHTMLAEELKAWKADKGLNPLSEFKWTKVSRKYLPLYAEMMEWLFRHLQANHLRFRSIVMDTSHRLYREFSEGEPEKGLYKAYYHLLFQSVKELWTGGQTEGALILLDEKRDRYPFQKHVLRTTLNRALARDMGVDKAVANIEDRRSSGPKAEVLIQPVDVLIGSIGFVRNGLSAQSTSSPAKRALVRVIEEASGTPLGYDTMPSSAFNLWTFDLKIAADRKAARKRQGQKRKRPQA